MFTNRLVLLPVARTSFRLDASSSIPQCPECVLESSLLGSGGIVGGCNGRAYKIAPEASEDMITNNQQHRIEVQNSPNLMRSSPHMSALDLSGAPCSN